MSFFTFRSWLSARRTRILSLGLMIAFCSQHRLLAGDAQVVPPLDPLVFQKLVIANAMDAGDASIQSAIKTLTDKNFFAARLFPALKPYLKAGPQLTADQLEQIAVDWLKRRHKEVQLSRVNTTQDKYSMLFIADRMYLRELCYTFDGAQVSVRRLRHDFGFLNPGAELGDP